MPSADLRHFSTRSMTALLVERGIVRLANEAAHNLLGTIVEGGDIRLAIRHPEALAHILPGTRGEVDITGIAQFGQPWTLSIRNIGQQSLLIRLIDRSTAIAAEKMRVDFVANASHDCAQPLATVLGYSETLATNRTRARACAPSSARRFAAKPSACCASSRF